MDSPLEEAGFKPSVPPKRHNSTRPQSAVGGTAAAERRLGEMMAWQAAALGLNRRPVLATRMVHRWDLKLAPRLAEPYRSSLTDCRGQPGTEGSNPAPSSGESVSAVNPRAVGEKPLKTPAVTAVDAAKANR
jgi:hypothetical protein